jgi:uncharacterized protein YjbI with pentapeptide repeats
MHSKDPSKSGGEFEKEFERILDEAEKTETEANFTGFVFVNSDFHGRTFNSACSFFRAEFSNQSNFIKVTFNGDANFALAKFACAVSFVGAKFEREAVFLGTEFSGRSEFGLATFAGNVYFAASKFNQNADFGSGVFHQSAGFGEAIFGQGADFGGAQFSQTADFQAAIFAKNASFRNVFFVGDAHFSRAVFSQTTLFRTARFSGAAVFRDTRFRHDLSTEPGLDFTDVKIEHPEKVEFYRTDLGQALFHNTDLTKVDFTLVQWRDRGRVKHYRWRRRWYCLRRFGAIRGRRVWLKRWELLSRLVRPREYRLCLFDEDVALAGIPALRLPERRLAKHCLSDHLASTYRQVKQDYDVAADFRTTNDWRQLNTRMRRFYGRFGWAWAKLAWTLRSPNMMSKRNYSLIAETYQQLKRNYDAKGDYWTGGYWHYGEMEMKRLNSRWRWRPLRWLGHHFSLVALYKYASAYGESYIMPLLWLVFFLAAFAFLYPIPGIEFNPPGNIPGWLGYVDWTTFFHAHPAEYPSGFWGMILDSLMTSLSVAGFQRELRYVPSYPWGRMLALCELLLTTTLGGLFLLAIRRHFKRS